MVFIFSAPWEQGQTCEAIKTTVLSLNGTVNDLGRGRLEAKWNLARKKPGILDHKCVFYVGDGVVRAVTDFQDTEIIVMVYRKLSKALAFWDLFLENLLRRYPDVDFGVKPGLPALAAIQFLDDGTKQVLVSDRIHCPSWSGAVLGGLLFGTAGAIVGGLGGESYTTTTARTVVSKDRIAMVRYSNGLVFRGRMINNGSLYQEIMANMSR